LEKRTIKSAATVLSFLKVADPDGDKVDASPPVYSNFVCEKNIARHYCTGKLLQSEAIFPLKIAFKAFGERAPPVPAGGSSPRSPRNFSSI